MYSFIFFLEVCGCFCTFPGWQGSQVSRSLSYCYSEQLRFFVFLGLLTLYQCATIRNSLRKQKPCITVTPSQSGLHMNNIELINSFRPIGQHYMLQESCSNLAQFCKNLARILHGPSRILHGLARINLVYMILHESCMCTVDGLEQCWKNLVWSCKNIALIFHGLS